jgi:hypothetical protein
LKHLLFNVDEFINSVNTDEIVSISPRPETDSVEQRVAPELSASDIDALLVEEFLANQASSHQYPTQQHQHHASEERPRPYPDRTLAYDSHARQRERASSSSRDSSSPRTQSERSPRTRDSPRMEMLGAGNTSPSSLNRGSPRSPRTLSLEHAIPSATAERRTSSPRFYTEQQASKGMRNSGEESGFGSKESPKEKRLEDTTANNSNATISQTNASTSATAKKPPPVPRKSAGQVSPHLFSFDCLLIYSVTLFVFELMKFFSLILIFFPIQASFRDFFLFLFYSL